jgi:hypothetical protein
MAGSEAGHDVLLEFNENVLFLAAVRSGSPKANEMVQWTISSDERRELGRAAVSARLA